ncbi:hypothetical protein S83_058722, partial [Arachis hypogaea]
VVLEFELFFSVVEVLKVLKMYHFLVTMTVVQFAVGTILVAFIWGLSTSSSYDNAEMTRSEKFNIANGHQARTDRKCLKLKWRKYTQLLVKLVVQKVYFVGCLDVNLKIFFGWIVLSVYASCA